MQTRQLPDGRILFSAREFKLPVMEKDFPSKCQLFSIHPGKQATLTRLIPQTEFEKLPPDSQIFELNPEASRAAIANSNGQVAVLTLATGEVDLIQPHKMDKLLSIPSWRSNEELCLVVPDGWREEGKPINPKRGQVVLWSKEGAKRLSKDWSEEARKGFLE